MSPEFRKELSAFTTLVKKVYEEKIGRACRNQDSVNVLFNAFDEALELLSKTSITMADAKGVLRTFEVIVRGNYVYQLRDGVIYEDATKIYFSTDPKKPLNKYLRPDFYEFTDYDKDWELFDINRDELFKHLGLEQA